MKRTFFALASALLTSLVMASCGSDSAIVGGACRTGFTMCGAQCVDLMNDPANCGSCAHACRVGISCQAGLCVGSFPVDGAADAIGADGGPIEDASVTDGVAGDSTVSGDGSSLADAPSDATMADAIGDTTPPAEAASDATIPPPDATPDATTPPTDAVADSTPLPPDATSDATSDATTDAIVNDATSDATTDAAANDATPSDTGADVLCAVPLLYCSAACRDVTIDPFNCGGCGIVCPSQLCRGSTCVGGTPGSFVYIGNDYAKASSAPQARVLSNAVFATGASSVKVLAYQRYADSNATAAAATILSAAAVRLGRTLQLTTTNTDTDIPTMLTISQYDTLLVFDQSSSPTGALAGLGASWASTLSSFTLSGGVVVILDGGLGTGEMPAFATSTTLLNVSAHTPLASGSELDVLIPSDVVGTGVITPYGAGADTVTVTTESPSGNVVYVVAPPSEGGTVKPAVVHKVF